MNEGRTLLELAVERGLVAAEQAARADQEIGAQHGGDYLVQLGLLDADQLATLRAAFQHELRTRSSFAPAARVGPRTALLAVKPLTPSTGSTSPAGRIGPYRLGRELGRGAMGVVHRAQDERRAIEVAIKLLPLEVAADPVRRRRLLEEARKAAMMEHCPHVVTVFEAGVVDDRAYLAMELVEGQTLEDWLRNPGDEEATADLLRQLVDGIAAAHSVGLVHRDIKPANLMVTSAGVLKILDFGLAKDLAGPRLEDSIDAVVGTPVYMAPELLQMALGLVPMNEAAARSARIDVYAVGITACEAFGRGRPFGPVRSYGELLEQKLAVQEILRRALGRRTTLPWRRVVRQMLAFDPMARPADGVALQHLLQHALTDEEKDPAPDPRLGALAAGTAALALTVAVLLGLLPIGLPVGATIAFLASVALVLLRRRPRPVAQTPPRSPRPVAQTQPRRTTQGGDSIPSSRQQVPPVTAERPESRPYLSSRDADLDMATSSMPRSSPGPGSPPAGGAGEPDHSLLSVPIRRINDLAFHEEYWIGPFCLKICVGDLTRLGAEGWVSPDNSMLSMGGGVSAAIAARLGTAHRRAVAALAPAPVGAVVVTDIGSPPVRHVLHAITIGVDEKGRGMLPTIASVSECVAEIFRHARRLRLRTLAIPALGTGAGGLPPLEVAKVICRRAIEQLADHTNATLQTVVFVASRADDPLLAAIRSHILDAGPREMVVRRGAGRAWTNSPAADAFVTVD